MKWGWPQLNSNHSSTTAKTTFPFHEGKKKMPCDEFPAAAHLVCDEDQQLTAEALEAARIAVNKQPGMMMFGTVSFGVFWGRLWRHMWWRKPYNIFMYISFMPIRYAYVCIYTYYMQVYGMSFKYVLPKNCMGGVGWPVFFWGSEGVLPFSGNLPDCLLMFQGMSKITSKRLQEIPPWKFKSSPMKISLPNRKVVFQPSFFRSYL